MITGHYIRIPPRDGRFLILIALVSEFFEKDLRDFLLEIFERFILFTVLFKGNLYPFFGFAYPDGYTVFLTPF